MTRIQDEQTTESMASHVLLDESAEGKRVIDPTGEEVGVVSGFRDGVAYVDLDPDLSERLASNLGWDGPEAHEQPLPQESIDRIRRDEIHLRRGF